MEVFDAEGKSIFDITPKKKKRYVLFLFKINRDNETRIRTIEKAIQNSLPEHILIRFEDANEGLKALLVKNIELIFVDYSLFDNDKISVEFALECKKRRKCPIFFTAKEDLVLIQEYRKTLFLYEELDDYFKEPIDFVEVSKKIKRISIAPARKAKRFSLNIPVQIYRLNDNQNYKVILSDISLVGFGIILPKSEKFVTNEQFRIKIPLQEFKIFHPQYGEFLPLSGKIRRISISGTNIGFSLENSTPMQIEALMNLLEKVTRKMRMLTLAEEPKEEFAKIPF
ncbi:PilZ domain-containing protein [Spirobacillus cienkowskii]|jgi:hypothetical protein|uniref:PilZ domain-containing protein n=1 Tax=Spirobacillus cienkowskii TaxID=495820 RepID=A0A369KRI0_9BACT|nr:MAG: hypothetical protein DCC88_10745 [Spirobacillus cienkowskii]